MDSIIPENIKGSRSFNYDFNKDAEVISYLMGGDNVLLDKRVNDAQACIEYLKDSVENIIYIDAKDKMPYRQTGKDLNDFLGFDYKTIKKDEVDCIIIDNLKMQCVDFFVYLDAILRFENNTTAAFGGIQMFIAANMYSPYDMPAGIIIADGVDGERVNHLHAVLHESYKELWSHLGFIVL